MKFLNTLIFILALNVSLKAQTPNLSFESFQTGFSSPTTITHAGDDRIFVLEQNGTIKIIENGNVTDFMDINNRVSSPSDNLNVYADELGLLGLAFDPDFENNGYFFLNYTNNDQNTVISRFSINSSNPNLGNADSEELVIEIEQPYSNHNGGCIAFGPDGYLYIGMGDGGNSGDPQGFGQNMTSLLGKILRLDVSSLPYSVPNDNPFVGNNNYFPEIWASGVRNPWKFSFDTQTGDLWIGDVGQNAWEEIDFQSSSSQGGENYGWNCFEGFASYENNGCNDNYTDPVHTYENNGYPNDCSITGGFVYRGTSYPNFNGHYVFGDYCTGKIFTLSDEGNTNFDLSTQENTDIFISCFGEDNNGELYLADRNTGEIFSIVDNSSNQSTSFNCVTEGCIDPNDGSGTYGTLQECEEMCLTSIKENLDEEISIYPNPNTNNSILNFKNIKDGSSVGISNLVGKKIILEFVSNNRIDLKNLKPGIYFIEIENQFKQKLIIK